MIVAAERAALLPTRREAVDAYHRSLTGHLGRLRSDTALTEGWPFATGVVEHAFRHLIADRLDPTGTSWGLSER
ncbi:hypothetical protein ACH4YO_40955 [Streptomyces noursei]|uniref:hypothetical protein n=1 Tax=Streptomyces noursei TaxID=1971 RepID=UPI00081C5A75|nr:hypothetical protein SNOUR_00530 [Streptomyces noursei ATCC 11455]ANZ21906.1 hypothetical protein SNOUR_43420 [Streptomyces noursei ATCC 11455]